MADSDQPRIIRFASFEVDITNGRAAIIAGSNGAPRTLLPNDYHDFGPRLGFAYQLTGDGKNRCARRLRAFFISSIVAASAISLRKNPPFSGEGSFSFFKRFSASHFLAPLPCVRPPARARTKPCRQPAHYRFHSPASISSVPTNISPIAWFSFESRPAGLSVQPTSATSTRHQSIAKALPMSAPTDRVSRETTTPISHCLIWIPAIQLRVCFANLGSVTVSDNRGKSIYNSLQAQYERPLHQWTAISGRLHLVQDHRRLLRAALDTCAPQLYTNYNIEARALRN